jgi:hypothetical protein
MILMLIDDYVALATQADENTPSAQCVRQVTAVD